MPAKTSDSPRSGEAFDALVIGAGPAGLIAAETLVGQGFRVAVADAMPTPARKFLLAGRGGLNLTHSEPLDVFLDRYGEARPRLEAAVAAYPPERLRAWSAELGEPTFVGSSGRVFPKSFKATALLRAWLRRLQAQGVTPLFNRRWTGFDADGAAQFASGESVAARAYVLALGGASWPRLGGNGDWAPILRGLGVEVHDLKAANGGFRVDWSPAFAGRFVGLPVKAVAWSAEGRTSRAEAVVTDYGLEGGALYALSSGLRPRLESAGEAVVTLDLKPDVTAEALAARLGDRRKGESLATLLRKKAHLAPVAIGLLREAGPLPDGAEALAQRIKACALKLTGLAPLERAISSAGGVAWSEVDAHFMLTKRPGCFVAGEMIDWEAPTGGYLLQGAFSSGAAAGQGASEWLRRPI